MERVNVKDLSFKTSTIKEEWPHVVLALLKHIFASISGLTQSPSSSPGSN